MPGWRCGCAPPGATTSRPGSDRWRSPRSPSGWRRVTGLWRPTLAPLNDLIPGLPWWASLAVLMLVVPLLAPLYWGEEFGWTSYLRLRIFPGRPLLTGAFLGGTLGATALTVIMTVPMALVA